MSDRNRAWRRWKQDVKVKRRLSRLHNSWRIKNCNDFIVESPKWVDRLFTWTHFLYKLNTSTRVDTRYNLWRKYSRTKFKKETSQILND